MKPRPSTQADGLTLVELLIAMSIFSLLGLFIFTLTRGSLDIYVSARGTGEVWDKFDLAHSALADDLSCAWIGDPAGSGPKSWFLLSHDRKYVPPRGVTLTERAAREREWAPGDPRSLLLRFVRTIPGGELGNTATRFAGTYAGAQGWLDGVDDERESRADEILRRQMGVDEEDPSQPSAPGLRPPAGVMEVMYFVDAGPADVPGTLTLYRAYRSPIGGAGSLSSDATIAGMTPEWIATHAEPVVSGLVYFGVLLWGQNTRSWGTERALSGEGERTAEGGPGELAEVWWDSARARYPAFGLHRGAASARRFEDDVFPRRAQFVLAFVEDGDDPSDGRLLVGVKANERRIRVSNTEPFERGERFLRAGNEWIEVLGVDGNDLRVRRGARRTASAPHEAGDGYVVGKTFTAVVEIPAWRSYFKGPGER